jgi:hypothetical protein
VAGSVVGPEASDSQGHGPGDDGDTKTEKPRRTLGLPQLALEVLHAVVGQVPDSDRRSIDLTGLDAAFGAAPEQRPASGD